MEDIKLIQIKLQCMQLASTIIKTHEDLIKVYKIILDEILKNK